MASLFEIVHCGNLYEIGTLQEKDGRRTVRRGRKLMRLSAHLTRKCFVHDLPFTKNYE